MKDYRAGKRHQSHTVSEITVPGTAAAAAYFFAANEETVAADRRQPTQISLREQGRLLCTE